MKTSHYALGRYWSVLLITVLLATGCQQDDPQVAPTPSTAKAIDQNLHYPCFVPVSVFTIRFNAIRYSNNCYYYPNRVCVRLLWFLKVKCWLPERYFDPFGPICLTCPEDIVKYIPRDLIPDFRRQIITTVKVDWQEHAVLFPITKGVVGLQFYSENRTITKDKYILPNDVTISAEEQKSLGIEGKVIPAGTYPVVYNEQNNTFNAIVAVR